MAYIRSLCQVTIDRPDADGIIEDGGFGRLVDFPFRDHRVTEENPSMFSEHPEDEWAYDSGGSFDVEFIPELRAVGPRGILQCRDMTLRDGDTGRWVMANAGDLDYYSDRWKLTPVVGYPQTAFALFYDTRAYSGQWGYAGTLVTHSSDPFPAEPNFTLRAVRWAPAPNAASNGYNYLEVHVIGDPDRSGQWALHVPGGGYGREQWRYPRLGWRRQASDDWTIVSEFRKALSARHVGRVKAYEQEVTWETIDKHFLLNIDGQQFVYYVPEQYRLSEPLIPRGPVGIYVYNHKAAVNLTEIAYPTSGAHVERAHRYGVDSGIFSTSNISTYCVAWEPFDGAWTTTVEVTEEYQSGEDEDTIKFYKPRVSFSSTGTQHHRAVCYLAQVDLKPSVSAGTSSSYGTQGNDVLVDAEGELSNSWRNARCRLVLEEDDDEADTLIANWKGNNKVTVTAGWDGEVSGDTATHFTGYLADRPMRREGSRPGRARVVLNCRDGFLRLERKYWQFLGNFTGWDLHEAFRRVLNQCGTPDDLIYVNGTAYGSFTGTTPTIPYSVRTGELRYDFDPGTGVIQGLNRIVAACAWTWGVNQSGQFHVRPPVGYDPGAGPDWTLDDDTLLRSVTPRADSTRVYHSPPGGKPFVNNVYVRVDRGHEVDEAWRRDRYSHQDSSAADFVGDDWWEVHTGTDEPSADALAQRILDERLQRQLLLRFRAVQVATDIGPTSIVDLMPDHFVRVQAAGLGIATDSIFQVVRKRWRCRNDPEDLRYEAEFECRYVG